MHVRYEQLLVLVTLAAFAAASTAAAAGVAVVWRKVDASGAGLSAAARARRLFALRLVPVTAGVLACAVSALAFLRHEPRATGETPEWILLASAALGALLVGASLVRVAARWSSTSRFLAAIERTATRVDRLPAIPAIPAMDVALPVWQLEIPFPLVALAGIRRPRLLIARRVLDQLPADELQVVLQHEIAHARRRDNVAGLLLSALPDVVGLADRWVGLDRAWRDAAEDAADDLATGTDDSARACLASAVVRVARMAQRQPVPAGPMLAFYSGESGESIERRVRRLTAGGPRRRASRPVALVAASVAFAAPALFLEAELLLGAHRAIEWLVHARL